jgi:hypothetical protein
LFVSFIDLSMDAHQPTSSHATRHSERRRELAMAVAAAGTPNSRSISACDASHAALWQLPRLFVLDV